MISLTGDHLYLDTANWFLLLQDSWYFSYFQHRCCTPQ